MRSDSLTPDGTPGRRERACSSVESRASACITRAGDRWRLRGAGARTARAGARAELVAAWVVGAGGQTEVVQSVALERQEGNRQVGGIADRRPQGAGGGFGRIGDWGEHVFATLRGGSDGTGVRVAQPGERQRSCGLSSFSLQPVLQTRRSERSCCKRRTPSALNGNAIGSATARRAARPTVGRAGHYCHPA